MNELSPSIDEGYSELPHRYFQIAGMTVRVSADLPFSDDTFAPKFDGFRVSGPGEDNISLHHHFALPDLFGRELGQRVYQIPPWAIHRRDDDWIYLSISPDDRDPQVHQVAVLDGGHNHGRIFHAHPEFFLRGGLASLTLFPTDQVLLARVLADRRACYFHASGAVLDGQGLLFVGHSEAGKSTTVMMLREEGEILCDERVIVRRWPEGFRVHGTWSHGDVPLVSSASAPLRAIFFLEKSDTNRAVPIVDRREVVRRLPFFVARPLVTADWWEKTLELVGEIAREVPVYRLQLDRSGRVVRVLRDLLQGLV